MDQPPSWSETAEGPSVPYVCEWDIHVARKARKGERRELIEDETGVSGSRIHSLIYAAIRSTSICWAPNTV